MKNYIEKAFTFAEYVSLIDKLLLENKTTGENQSEEMFHYGKMNRQRMKRLEKTIVLQESLKEKVRKLTKPQIWLILTEGWCGDAAQSLPVLEKIVAENPLIQTKYLLRDENLELMDQYLTNNARSIPKLIILDAETLEELATWGPRPQNAMDYFNEMKQQDVEKLEIMEKLQRWYLDDKTVSIQKEFEEIFDKFSDFTSAIGE